VCVYVRVAIIMFGSCIIYVERSLGFVRHKENYVLQLKPKLDRT
jgi:hypothetical protein